MQPVSEVKKLKEWGTVKLKTIPEGVLDIKKFIDRKVARKVKEGREERGIRIDLERTKSLVREIARISYKQQIIFGWFKNIRWRV